MKTKKEDLTMFRMEIESKEKQIRILIEAIDPLDLVNIAHAIIYESEPFKKTKPQYKVLPQ